MTLPRLANLCRLLLWLPLLTGSVGAAAERGAEAALAGRFEAAAARGGAVIWTPRSAAGATAANWFLDGERGRVVETAQGFELHAGPTPGANADHVVWWTRQEFSGDLRIDFDYTRLDEATDDVNILYLFARGSGQAPYVADLAAWSTLRHEPRMSWYFNHLHAYHVSFAAFGDPAHPGVDYVRARRYVPETDRHLAGTELAPDHFATGLFQPGLTYHCTVLRAGADLFLQVRPAAERGGGPDTGRLFHWDLRQAPPLDVGRIGLRHMAGRSARYDGFTVRALNPPVAVPAAADAVGVDWSHASPRSPRYRVWVDGTEVFVGDFWSEHFAQFRWHPGVEVEVQLGGETIDAAQSGVSPRRLGVAWTVDGDRLRFRLDQPHAYVVRLNTPQTPGVELNYLTLLAEDPAVWRIATAPVRAGEIDVIAAGVDPTGVVDATAQLERLVMAGGESPRLYFPAGTYAIEDWRIERSGVSLRLAPGAYLHAREPGTKRQRRRALSINEAADATVQGLGLIEAHGYVLSVAKSPRLTLDGPMLRSDALGKEGVTPSGNEDGGRGLSLNFSDGYHLRNVKIFTVIDQVAGKGKDAMNLGSSSDGLVEHCFTMSGDDTYTIKGRHDAGEWLQVDLGAARELDRVVVRWGRSWFSRYELQGSLDGITWVTLAETAIPAGQAPAADGEVSTVAGRARFVRVQSRGLPVDFFRADFIRELEVYGAGDAVRNLARGGPVAVSPFGAPWSAAHVPAMAVDGDPATGWANAYRSQRVLLRDNVALVTANSVKIGTGADYAGDDITWEDHDTIDAGWAHGQGFGGGNIEFSHYNFDHRPEEMAMRRIRLRNVRFEDTTGLVEVGWYFWRNDQHFIFATDLDAELENVTFDQVHPDRARFRVQANPETARIRLRFINLKVAGQWIRNWDDLRTVGVKVDLQGLTDDDAITFEVRE